MALSWRQLGLVLFALLLGASLVLGKDISKTTGDNLVKVYFPAEQPLVNFSPAVNTRSLNYTFILSSVREVDSAGATVGDYPLTSVKWVDGGSTEAETDITVGENKKALRLSAEVKASSLELTVVLSSDFPYKSPHNSLVFVFKAYSTLQNTTIVNKPNSFVESTVIQGLSGRDSLVISFSSNLQTDDGPVSYSNEVTSTDAAYVSLRFPANSQYSKTVITFTVEDTTRMPDSVAVTTDGLRVYYQPQDWGVILNSQGISQASFQLHFVSLEEVDPEGNLVQNASFTDFTSRWWGPYNVSKTIFSVSSFGEISLNNGSDTSQLSLETVVYGSDEVIYSGDHALEVQANSFKWTIDVYSWPFQDEANSLVVRLRIPLETGMTHSNLTTDANGFSSASLSRQPTGVLQLHFMGSAIVDNVLTPISISKETGVVANSVDFKVTFPSFYTKASYDPIAQVVDHPIQSSVNIPTEEFIATFAPEDPIQLSLTHSELKLNYSIVLGSYQEVNRTHAVLLEALPSTFDVVLSDAVTLVSGEININVTLTIPTSNFTATSVGEFYLTPNTSSIKWRWNVEGWDFDKAENHLHVNFQILATESGTSFTPTPVFGSDENAVSALVFEGDKGEHTLTISIEPTAILDNEEADMLTTFVGPSSLAIELESFEKATSGFIFAQVSDTRNGGGCKTSRVLKTADVTFTLSAVNAKISITPTRRTELFYTVELVDITERTSSGEIVTQVPSIWWSSDCFGPYNVTEDIQYIRAQYSLVVPGSAIQTTIDFNAFVHKEPTSVHNQDEMISIGDDTLKFDLDIRNWPFKNTTNRLVLQYRITSNKYNKRVLRLNTPQKSVIIEGNLGHDSLLYLFPQNAEVASGIVGVDVDVTPDESSNSTNVFLSFPYFQQRIFYDPTLGLHHTVPNLFYNTTNLAVTWLADMIGFLFTDPELVSVQDYTFKLVEIAEETAGREPVRVKTLTSDNVKGGWYPVDFAKSEVVDFKGVGELPNNEEVLLQFKSELYQQAQVVPYANDTVETLDDSLRVGINLQTWPFKSSSNVLRVHFRITFFNFLTNETEMWFHRVGSDRFMDYIIIEGGVANSRILHIKFPRSSIVDGENSRILGSIAIEKTAADTLDLTFTFPSFEDSIRYDVVFYIGRPNINWILLLVGAVICFTLIMAAYAIVHKLRRYESVP